MPHKLLKTAEMKLQEHTVVISRVNPLNPFIQDTRIVDLDKATPEQLLESEQALTSSVPQEYESIPSDIGNTSYTERSKGFSWATLSALGAGAIVQPRPLVAIAGIVTFGVCAYKSFLSFRAAYELKEAVPSLTEQSKKHRWELIELARSNIAKLTGNDNSSSSGMHPA